MLVEKMWENIIDKELSDSAELPTNSRLVMVSNKVKGLGKIYSQAQKYFPIGNWFSYIKTCKLNLSKHFWQQFSFRLSEFIARKLELFSCLSNSEHSWVYQVLLNVGISLPKVLDVYNK